MTRDHSLDEIGTQECPLENISHASAEQKRWCTAAEIGEQRNSDGQTDRQIPVLDHPGVVHAPIYPYI